MGLTNAASYEAGPAVPGGLITLFGAGLGPSQMFAAANPQTMLAGTQVTFDGIAAPVLYASSLQVSAITPREIAGRNSVTVQVAYNGVKSPAVVPPVAESWPALFSINASGHGPGAVLNQDGWLNSSRNPASRGTALQMFGTGGLGPPLRVLLGGVPAVVSYAGHAPGLVDGVFQINATIPMGVTPGDAVPLIIEAGGNASLPNVTVAIR